MNWLFPYLLTLEAQHKVDWRREAESAESFGFGAFSFDLERFLADDLEGALAELPPGDGSVIGYRGYILLPDQYEFLADGVSRRGYRMLTNPSQYARSSRLPEWYPAVSDLTPAAIWTESDDAAEAWELAVNAFGPPPWIIKDHVKSRKQYWLEACFIAADADFASFKQSCATMVEQRGEEFTGGLVVRPFVPLKFVTADWTGMPMFEEYRLFFWRGEFFHSEIYNPVGRPEENFTEFLDLGSRVDSDFFTADVARTEEGELILIEINDGGVSGIPPDMHPDELYGLIAERVFDDEKL